MQIAEQVKWMEFDFLYMFYKKQDWHKPKIVEQWFDEGVALHRQPTCCGQDGGSVMKIAQWLDQSLPGRVSTAGEDPYILLQVLQVMPLRLNGFDEANAVLHELVVVAWSCRPTVFKHADQGYIGTKRKEEQFFLVMDKWVSWSKLHCSNENHMCLFFTCEQYSKMLQNSQELGKQLDEEVEWGLVANLGRTVQEVSQNDHDYHRARLTLRRVFDLVDVAYFSLKEETKITDLQHVSLHITDQLSLVKKPPMPSPNRSAD